MSSSNFPPRKSVFRVRLTGNKTKQEMKTGNSSLLYSHNRDKLNTSMGGLFLNFELALYFQTKIKGNFKRVSWYKWCSRQNDVACFWHRAKFCFWSIIANIIYTDTRQPTGNAANIIYLRISKRQYFGFLIWVCNQVMGS